jgi:hypothetical protein
METFSESIGWLYLRLSTGDETDVSLLKFDKLGYIYDVSFHPSPSQPFFAGIVSGEPRDEPAGLSLQR